MDAEAEINMKATAAAQPSRPATARMRLVVF
jgi:hypothetical protein